MIWVLSRPGGHAPAFIIYRMGRLLLSNLRSGLRDLDPPITPEQYFMVYRLYRQDGRTLSSLADPALGDYPNITRLVDALEKKGLIKREANPEDRRQFLVFLTEKGRTLMDTLLPQIQKDRGDLFGSFSEAEIRQFTGRSRS